MLTKFLQTSIIVVAILSVTSKELWAQSWCYSYASCVNQAIGAYWSTCEGGSKKSNQEACGALASATQGCDANFWTYCSQNQNLDAAKVKPSTDANVGKYGETKDAINKKINNVLEKKD